MQIESVFPITSRKPIFYKYSTEIKVRKKNLKNIETIQFLNFLQSIFFIQSQKKALKMFDPETWCKKEPFVFQALSNQV